jgi:vacuolar-type H+-ATPase subunit H
MKSLETIATPEVDAAIARVLAAEQAARRAVEQCEAEARLRVEAAQARARRIAERAARRVARSSLDATIAAHRRDQCRARGAGRR